MQNDIVILGSDGVFDNVFDDLIVKECVNPNLRNALLESPQEVASCISTVAEISSYNPNLYTPYTESAVKHGKNREENLGGKQDDITVVVGQVKLH